MRNPGKIVQVFKRETNTNQRIHFDLTIDAKHLCTGNTNGMVSVWDLNSAVDDQEEEQSVACSFRSHHDCVNGVSFHPTRNLLATASGQRKPKSNENSSDSEQEENNAPEPQLRENSLKIWKYSF